jgi:hypothetical protein
VNWNKLKIILIHNTARKGFYGINTMVIANDTKRICSLDVAWHGAAHDARVWRHSFARDEVMKRRYYLAGDSAYPISDHLIKPYSVNKALRDPRRRLFNTRLCGLRTEMSENVYGMWKRRFPVLRNL